MTVILIVILLLIAYRSITIALIPLFGVLTTLAVARGIISFLVGQGVIEISSFASNLLVSLVLGASTDYAIFYLGRYQEARQNGEDKESSYYESVANVPHVILGSGIAISGATLCLSLTHLDYFRTLGSAVCGVDGGRRPLGADPGPRAAHDGEQDRLDPAA